MESEHQLPPQSLPEQTFDWERGGLGERKAGVPSPFPLLPTPQPLPRLRLQRRLMKLQITVFPLSVLRIHRAL